MFLTLPYLISLLLFTFAKETDFFYAAAVFAGIGNGFYSVSLPMYVGEISEPHIRETWGILVMIMLYLGACLSRLMKTYLTPIQVGYIFVVLPFIYLLLMLFVPESPYFYIMTKKDENARKSLKFLYRKENVDKEYAICQAVVSHQLSETGSWCDLFEKSNRKALIAGIYLRFSQIMTGPFVVVYTESGIFRDFPSKTNRLSLFSMYVSLIVFSAFNAASFFKRFGRRLNYMSSMFGCSFALFSVSLFLSTQEFVSSIHLDWVPIWLMMIYIIMLSLGVATVPSIMLSELFSLAIKSKALTVVTIVAASTQIFSLLIFYVLTIKIDFFAPFMFFGISSCLLGMISGKILPETKGMTLEEIQQMLSSRR